MGAWFQNLLSGIAYWFRQAIGGFIKFSTMTWAVITFAAGVAYVVGQFAVRGVNSIITEITQLPATVGSMNAGTLAVPNSTVSTILQVTNTFTPLDEAFEYISMYLTLAVIVISYRQLKSWLPAGFGNI